MAPGYEAQIGAIRKAARSAASAGEQAGQVDLAGSISGVGAALPGSQSASAAGTLASAWANLVQTWSGDAQKYADSLSAAADGYLGNEDAAKQDFPTVTNAQSDADPI